MKRGQRRRGAVGVFVVALGLASCANAPDQFYTLSGPTAPPAPPTQNHAPRAQVRLTLALPQVLERDELIVSTSANQVSVLEHARWASSFGDQFGHVMARDLEVERPEVWVDESSLGAGPARLRLHLELIDVQAKRTGQAQIAARWRIVDTSTSVRLLDEMLVQVPLESEAPAAVAQAYSQCAAHLARRIGQDLADVLVRPPRDTGIANNSP